MTAAMAAVIMIITNADVWRISKPVFVTKRLWRNYPPLIIKAYFSLNCLFGVVLFHYYGVVGEYDPVTRLYAFKRLCGDGAYRHAPLIYPFTKPIMASLNG